MISVLQCCYCRQVNLHASGVERLRIIIWLLTGLAIPDEGHRDTQALRLLFLTIANMTQHGNDMSVTLTTVRFHSLMFFNNN